MKKIKKILSVLLAAGMVAGGMSVQVLADTSGQNSSVIAADVPAGAQAVIDALGGESVAEYDNGIIRLKSDAHPTSTVNITGESGVTGLDLASYKIEGDKCLVNVASAANVTISGKGKIVETGHERGINVKNGTVTMAGGTAETNATKGYAVYLQDGGTFILDGGNVKAGESCYGVTVMGNNANLQVKNGSIEAYNFAISGNGGTDAQTKIGITGGSITSTNDVAIYHPQNGEMEISGGNITGAAGIVARAGKITISGQANITATGHGTVQPGTTEDNIPDAAVVGDKIPGSDYKSDTLKITILGGNLKSEEGVPAVSLTENGAEPESIDHQVFSVRGGHFENPGKNFTKYVDDSCVAAKKGADSNETVVGADLQSVADELGITSGDTLVVEKAPAGASVDGLKSGIHVDNQSGNDISVNGESVPDKQSTDTDGAYTTALEAAIQDAESRKQEDYTPESWNKLQEALKAAKTLMEGPLSKDKQGEVETATQNLAKALEDLVPKESGRADYTDYDKALAEANSALRRDYSVTDEKWNAFRKAVDDIDKGLKKDLTVKDQKTVDDAAQAIRDAIATLGKKVEKGSYVITVSARENAGSTSGIPLKGVKFGFYGTTDGVADENPYITAETNETGSVRVELPFGTYVVRCLGGPEGYLYQSSERAITIDNHAGGSMEWIVFSDGKQTEIRKIFVTVTDRKGKGLANVLIRVRNSSTDRYYVTGSDGKLTISDLIYGTYRVSIARVPSGYLLDTTPKEITLTSAADVNVPTFVVKQKSSGSSGSGSGSGSGSSHSGSSGSSGPSHSAGPSAPAGSVSGTWTYDRAHDKWTLDDHRYRNQWVYVYNPYAKAGQNSTDWFAFDENGNMRTGWFSDRDGNWYYLNEASDGTKGAMLTGWFLDNDGNWYHLNENSDGTKGAMKTGWFLDKDGYWYYLNETSDGTKGAMKTGWQWVNRKCYYLSELSDGLKGHLLTSTTTPDGYTVDASGAWTENGEIVVR